MNAIEKHPGKDTPRHVLTAASRIVDGQAVIVLPDKAEVKVLNKVGSRIWELCDGNRTISEIVDIIYNKFEQEKSIIEKDIIEFVDELERKGMLVIEDKAIGQ